MSRGYFDTNDERDEKNTVNKGQGSDKSRAVGSGGISENDKLGNDLMQGEDIGKGFQHSRREPGPTDTEEDE